MNYRSYYAQKSASTDSDSFGGIGPIFAITSLVALAVVGLVVQSVQEKGLAGSRFLGGERRRAIADVRREILTKYSIEPNYVLEQGWEAPLWRGGAIDPAAKAAVMAQMAAYANE